MSYSRQSSAQQSANYLRSARWNVDAASLGQCLKLALETQFVWRYGSERKDARVWFKHSGKPLTGHQGSWQISFYLPLRWHGPSWSSLLDTTPMQRLG